MSEISLPTKLTIYSGFFYKSMLGWKPFFALNARTTPGNCLSIIGISNKQNCVDLHKNISTVNIIS